MSSFVWIFGTIDTNLTIFNKSLTSSNHIEPLLFTFNPPFPESVFHIDIKIVILILNGRVYENANFDDLEFLTNLEHWSYIFVSKPLMPLFYDLRTKKKEIMIFLKCVFVDWIMN